MRCPRLAKFKLRPSGRKPVQPLRRSSVKTVAGSPPKRAKARGVSRGGGHPEVLAEQGRPPSSDVLAEQGRPQSAQRVSRAGSATAVRWQAKLRAVCRAFAHAWCGIVSNASEALDTIRYDHGIAEAVSSDWLSMVWLRATGLASLQCSAWALLSFWHTHGAVCRCGAWCLGMLVP